MRDLDLTTLRLFAAVCDARSIARAAEQAHIVGSAVSKRLAQLEDTVGTPLLVRRRRGVEPTPAGQSLLEHARAMLDSADRIAREMGDYALGVRGHVSSPTFIVAREHAAVPRQDGTRGPGLVHVDAYRLGGLDELDALDLDASLEECVTVVEWGHGLAEGLAEEYLEVALSGETARTLRLERHGARWARLEL